MLMDDFKFDCLRDEDYESFIDCLNDFYSGGYPYKEYIEKEFLLDRIADNSMIVTIARNKDSEVVGTVAALLQKEHFDGSVLLLLRSVRSDYRAQGIGSNLLKYLLSLVEKQFEKARSLYADVLTHNIISQSSLVHKGFAITGIRMMLYDNEIMVSKLGLEGGTKMSQAIYCKAIGHEPVTVYAPEKHHGIIRDIYENLEVDCTVLPPTELGLCDKTEMDIEVNKMHKSIEVFITRVGTDIETCIKDVSNRFIIDDKYTAIVFVNMSENIGNICELLEKYNFYFSGIKPLSNDAEYLIMANTDNCKENLQDIMLEENAFELKKYVLKEMRRNEKE